MHTQEIADRLVTLCREGKFDAAYQELFSDKIVSVEAHGPALVTEGMEAVLAKAEWWSQTFEVLGVEISDARANGNHFIVEMKLDVKTRETGEEVHMEEYALYEVADGKIVRETFFYGAG